MLTEELQARAKKRFRITLVCSVCKSRKVKCDRKEPCTSCIKYNTIHLCNYDDPKWMTPAGAVGKSEVHEELGELKRKLVNLEAWITKNDSHSLTATDIKVVNKEFHNLNSVIGINPILSPIEIWNLYSSIAIVRYGKFDGRSIDFLPFTFHGVLRRDPGLLDLWYSLTERREILLREKSGGIDDSRGLLFGGNVVALQECDTFGELPASKRILMKIRHYLELRAKGYKITPGGVIGGGDGSGASRVKTGRPGQNSLPGISSSPVSDDDLFLPPDNVIWNYISIFFKYIYRYIPYLDEETFTTSVERIMSSMSSGVRGRRLKGDYAVLGQLYIVLRLAYLSCIPNNSNDLNNPLLYVIGTEYIDMAKKCLNSYQFDLGIELSVVQCCLLLCIYLNLAPEDADGPDKNQFQVLTGSLVQMANSIALNREPTKYKELSTTIKMDHLRRKIWYEIRFLDLKLTIAFGNPPNVQTRYFDTMTPFYTEGCSNVLGQPGLENELLKFNDVKDTILSETKTFVDNMLNINENVKLIETAQYLSKMELLLQREFGSLSDYDEKGLKGSLNMRLFVSLRLFQQFLYYDLFCTMNVKTMLIICIFILKRS